MSMAERRAGTFVKKRGAMDLASNQAIYQVSVELWTDSGLPMTYNPFWIEATSNGLRAYFMPEDEKSTLYIYQAEVK
jgi:hypothetical protein